MKISAFLAAVLVSLAVLLTPGVGSAALPHGFAGMVSEDSLAGTPEYRTTQMTAMAASGVTLLRQTFDWAQIEQKKGTYSFATYDAFVGEAARHGIEVMPILFNPPTFRSARPKGNKTHGTYPPKSNSAFARFAGRAVARYGPSGTYWSENPDVPKRPIRRWQVWNEPNLKVYWLPKTKASAYVRLLKAASQKIRALDSGAEVVGAGLPESHAGVPLVEYITDVLKAGGGRWMDTIGINPYARTASGVVSLLKKVRKTLDSKGHGDVAIRATELGWSDVGPGSKYKRGSAGQATQIKSVVGKLAKARKSLKLSGFVYFNWRDAPPYAGFRDFWGLHTGLLRMNGTEKPAAAAFAKAVEAAE